MCLLTCFECKVFCAVLFPEEFEEWDDEKELVDLGNSLLMTEESHVVLLHYFSVMRYLSFMSV